MSIETFCPNPDCRKRFQVADNLAGRIARCKHCSTRFRIRPGEGERLDDAAKNVFPASRPVPIPAVAPSPAAEPPPRPLATASEGSPASVAPAESAFRPDPLVTQADTLQPQAGAVAISGAQVNVAAPQIEPSHPEATMAEGPDDRSPDAAFGVAVAGDESSDDAAVAKAAEDEVPLVWSPGDVLLNLYEVKELLGQGSFGNVYKAHHRTWSIDLAVKNPRPERFQTEEQKAEFEHECQRWIELGLHPNVVSCHYVRRLGGVPRVFAEYVDGGTLKKWIEEGRLYEGGHQEALKRMLDVAIQFAWALQYAHEKGLVHQDVKPENVMMTADGTPKLADFGLAKLGTPAYCSPEQAARKPLTPSADIWSWGVSVLHMFIGELTWPSGTIARAVLEEYLATGPTDDSIPNMPAALGALLGECFREEPDERLKNMQDVAGRLHGTYQETTGAEYAREKPKAAELLADGLNNRAVSMLDLGKKEEAEQLFDEALRVDGHHPEATYNRGLLRWRSGRLADSQLVQELEQVGKVPMYRNRAGHLKGSVHLERGDTESAITCFREVEKAEPSWQEVARDIERARSNSGCRLLRTLEARPQQGSRPSSNGGDIWEQMLGHVMHNLRESVEAVAIDSDGRWCVSGGAALSLWDLDTGDCLRTQEVGEGRATAIAASADFLKVVAGTQDGRLLIWEPQHGRYSEMSERHAGQIGFIALAENGDKVRSACWGGEVRLWGLQERDCQGTWRDPDHGRTCIAVTPDGRRAVCGTAEYHLRLWDLSTGRSLRTFDGHVGPVISAAVSPNGRFLLSGSGDTTLRLWELATGKCLRILGGHTDWVTSVAFTFDGRFGLSGSADKTLRFWDLAERVNGFETTAGRN